MGELFDRTQKSLIKRRENIVNGNINSIPSPFRRFKNDFVGFEQNSYLCITSFTKGGKTQFTLYLLFEALMYVLEHPGKADLKVFYIALEETDERILHRFESYLLMKLDKIRISPKNLRSTDNENPVPQEILNLLESERYQKYIKAFEEKFVFSSIANPTGIYKLCQTYAEEHGVTHYKKIRMKDEFGNVEEKSIFDYYVMDNPQEFRICVLDHIGLSSTERGMSLKESIDLISKNFVKLKNRYGFTPIVIQQQSTTNESNDSLKLKNIRPSGRGLADSTYIQRDVTQLLGLFSPFKFGLEKYPLTGMSYDITKFKDHIRFLEVCNARDGEIGGMIALFFDGATCTFYELPPPGDPAINKWYDYLEHLKN